MAAQNHLLKPPISRLMAPMAAKHGAQSSWKVMKAKAATGTSRAEPVVAASDAM